MKEPGFYIKNKLKPPKKMFEWCYSQISTYKRSNKNQTIFASARKNCYVIEKKLTKRTRLTFFDKFYSFAILLVTTKRIEIQAYSFWSSMDNGKQIIKLELSSFEQFANNQRIKVSTMDKENYGFGLLPNYGMMSSPYTGTKFYSNDWENRIKEVSELKYLKLDFFTVMIWITYKNIERRLNFFKKSMLVFYPIKLCLEIVSI